MGIVSGWKRAEDDFLTKTKCDRCGGPLTTRIMSMYNLDVICGECKRKEQERPDYAKARDTEMEEVKRGNRNFAGIGFPPNEE